MANGNGNDATPQRCQLTLELNLETAHLSITGNPPNYDVALEMCRRGELEFMKLIEAAKRPRVDRVSGNVLEVLDRARQKGGNLT